MTPGQAAYEAWHCQIKPPPPLSWGGLPSEARDGWEKIAEAARTVSVAAVTEEQK